MMVECAHANCAIQTVHAAKTQIYTLAEIEVEIRMGNKETSA